MAQKFEAKGGELGDVWDDGVHEGVRKVYIAYGQDCIAFVKFEYVDGSQVVVGDAHGPQTLQRTDEFEVDADDYIVSVEGFLKEVTEDTIVVLKFVTYKGKTNLNFVTSPEAKFVLQGGKIVGFHGRSSDVLHSLGAYVSFPTTPELLGKWIKVEQKGEGPGLRCSHAIAQVGNKIYSFGGELIPNQPIDKDLYVFDIETRTWSISPATGDVPHLSCLGVRMVSVGLTLYVFGGRDASRQYNGFYSFDTTTNEWKLLTPVEEGPTPRSFHSMAADENNVYVFGGVIAADRVNTIDAYNIVDQKWVKCATPGESFIIRGGAGVEVVQGKVWVVYGFTGYELGDIHYYDPVEDKWTQVKTFGEKPSARSVFASAVVGKHIVIFGGEIAMDLRGHAGPGKLIGGTFALNTETLKWERLDKQGEEEETPNIRGWSASTSGTINGKKGLVMLGGKAQTNGRFDDLFFYGVDSTLTRAKKLTAVGGNGGTDWNDGVHDGVRKVHVGQGQDGVSFINVVYEKGSQEVEGGEHGNLTLLGFETFEVDADDYITEVHVSYDKIFGQESDVITSITFYTFKGKASPPYGLDTEKKLVLKDKNGGKLVGFHGRAGEVLHALGAYFATPAKKLRAVGSDGGTAWDDGAYDGVKKVYVGQAQDGVSVVKFVYDKGAEEIIGDEHGYSTLLGFEEFVLDYPSEYITSVEGTYDQIFGSDYAVVTMLRFKTNKQTSAPFGIEAGTPFELKEEGSKIVGFHGKVGELLHQFGVHVRPIGY